MLITLIVAVLSVAAVRSDFSTGIPPEATSKPKLVVSSIIHVIKPRHLKQADKGQNIFFWDKPKDPPSKPRLRHMTHYVLRREAPPAEPTSFLPPLPVFNFQPLINPFAGQGNYNLLVNRVAYLEREIRILKEKMAKLNSVVHCANITASASCSGLPEIQVVPVTTETGGAEISGFVTSQSSSSTTNGEGSGVIVSSTYTKPGDGEGHGTVTVQHFGNRP
ncbi:uncharacterized protein [Periplaneta americana]|uniref:uncharacterized protein n=1 Tax=Periplaneta americana TaxID=6978 RepID=UPI0037E89D3D